MLLFASLDRKAMITVAPNPDETTSSKTVFDTKGLGVIWGTLLYLALAQTDFFVRQIPRVLFTKEYHPCNASDSFD